MSVLVTPAFAAEQITLFAFECIIIILSSFVHITVLKRNAKHAKIQTRFPFGAEFLISPFLFTTPAANNLTSLDSLETNNLRHKAVKHFNYCVRQYSTVRFCAVSEDRQITVD